MKISRKKGFTMRGICVVVVLFGILGGVFGPKYIKQIEQPQVLAMQAMMINIMIAQDTYYSKTGNYTDRWATLLPLLDQPASLEVQLQAVAGEPQKYFFGFGKKAIKKHCGYVVSLQLAADKQQGEITAERSKNLFYSYMLTQPFPAGEVQCISQKHAKNLCKNFLKQAQELSFKNLIPIPKQDAAAH